MKTKIKDGIISVERHKLGNRLRLVWLSASLLMIIAGVASLILIQKPISEPQLIQKQASVADGQVHVGHEKAGSFKVGETSRIYLTLNTSQVQIDGVELTFKVVTNTIDHLKVRFLPQTNLEVSKLELDAASNGFLINAAAIATSTPFSSNSDVNIIELEFTPVRGGSIVMNFDADKSVAIVSNTDPHEDELKHIASMEFNVDGDSIKSCNETCDNNSQCPANYLCYETSDGNRCRLAEDPGDTDCKLTDDGLNFGCNHYCADKSECADKYDCLENRCRLADNPDDTYCRQASDDIIYSYQQNCNETCTSDTDCVTNLFCYYGSCRLKSNPSSTSCSSATKKIVYKTVYQSTVASNSGKGGDLTDQMQAEEKSSSESASTTMVEEEEEEIEIPYQSDMEVSQVEETPAEDIENQSALESLISNLRDRGSSLSLILIVAGMALIIIIILASILSRFKKPSSGSANKVSQKAPISPEAEQRMQSLQERIKTLQNTPPPSATLNQESHSKSDRPLGEITNTSTPLSASNQEFNQETENQESFRNPQVSNYESQPTQQPTTNNQLTDNSQTTVFQSNDPNNTQGST